jgi:thiamine pyrophosphokinase
VESTSNPTIGPAIVLAGGTPVDPGIAAQLPAGATVIAADSGLAQAALLGLDADVVIGDMDSVEPDLLAAAAVAGARIIRHPRDKDATDLELALGSAVAAGHDPVTIAGGHGGRIDHLLANALLLADPAFAGVDLTWWVDGFRLRVTHGGARSVIDAPAGTLVSLIPVGGSAQGVTTHGLQWPLDGETLHHGSTRGISNRIETPPAEVTLTAGTLLVATERNPG